jgi:hypothetical protein
MPWARVLVVVLLMSGTVLSQQVIDPTEYLPVGSFNVWLMEEVGDPLDIEVIETKATLFVDGVVQYRVVIPSVQELKRVVFVFGVEDGVMKIYGANVTSGVFDDEFQVERVTIEPPLSLADGAFTNIDTTIQISAKIADKKLSAKVRVTGTASVNWQAGFADVSTPAGLFPAADVAEMQVFFDLNFFSNSNPDLEIDEDVFESVGVTLAKDVGLIKVDGKNGKQWRLKKAILPGKTVGDDFSPLPADVTKVTFDVPPPGLLLLEDAVADPATDGFVTLSDLYMHHQLGGKLSLSGQVNVGGAPPKLEDGELLLKGKVKPNLTTGGFLVTLKGKARHPALPKPVVFKLKQEITGASTDVTIAYKAGKDAEGNPILGTLTLPITPETTNEVTVDLNGLVDTRIELKGKARKLGTEGTLTVGNVSYPVILKEVAKSKEGLPDKQVYSMFPTELGKPKIMKFAASSTNPLDYAMTKFAAKVLGLKVKPESIDEVEYEVE